MTRLALLLTLLLAAGVASAGEIHEGLEVPSPALDRPLGYAIYMPDGLKPDEALPVIYLLHGVDGHVEDWISQGRLKETADQLIAEKRLPRVLIVMPEAGNSWYVDSPAGGDGAVATAMWRDLPAAIERHYPAASGRRDRAIAGYSMGGFGAVRLALGHPERYAAAAAMSGAWWSGMKSNEHFDQARMERMKHIFGTAFGDPFSPRRFVAESPMSLARPMAGPIPALFLTCGTGDRFGLADEQADMVHRLEAAHIPVQAELTPGDHDWETWSAALPKVLEFLGRNLK